MMKLLNKFVKHIPENMEDGVLYISMEYATAIHKCCCGCGGQVVTPLSPKSWQLAFDGETVSLSPSIGNWSFNCQSHYWIVNNQVEWAPIWTKKHIDCVRRKEAKNSEDHFAAKKNESILDYFFKKKRPSR